MQNRSNHQEFKVTRKWVFDGSLFSLMIMSVIIYLLHVNGIGKTSVLWLCESCKDNKGASFCFELLMIFGDG